MDDPGGLWRIILPVAFLMAGWYFALFETALAESSRSRVEHFADEGDERAAKALRLADDPDMLLSALSGASGFSGICAGAAASFAIAPLILPFFKFLPRKEIFAVLTSVAIVAAAYLLFCEFLPKKIASRDPEKTLLEHVGMISAFDKISRPFASLLSRAANSALLLFGVNPHIEDAVTEEEVKDLIEQGTEDGTFEKAEQDMVDRIFHMSDQTAYALMTPRTRMKWLDVEDTLRHNLGVIRKNPGPVFPVGKGNLDNFLGIVRTKDILDAAIDGKPLDIEAHIKEPLIIPRSTETFRVLEKFREGSVREGVVMDEYGGVIGFITLGDIIEEIIGDTAKAGGENFSEITPRDERSWYIDGLLSIDDFKEKFDVEELPEEESDHYQTMGGFLTSYFGYIPKAGEKCDWDDFSFEVLRLDRARVAKILVTRKEQKI